MAKRSFRKKTYRRRFKRSFKRKYRKGRVGNKVHFFTRYADFSPVVIDNIANTYTSFNFSLNDLPNYTEWTVLYDMYKINGVKITFLPQMTQNISLSTVNNPYANTRFFSAIDYNDSSPPASVDELRQYKTCKYTPILRKHKRYIYKPKILDSTGYTPGNPWISTNSPAVLYYGLKVAIENMGSTISATMEYSVEVKFYLSFKNVK